MSPWQVRRPSLPGAIVRRAAALLLLALLGAGAAAATRTASVSGNWNNTATWGGAAVPVAADVAIISTGVTVTLNVDATITRITINSGGTLTGTLGAAKTLTVTNGTNPDISNSGTINFQQQVSGVTQPLGYLKFGTSALQWGGNGTWNLYSVNFNSRGLTFATGTTATIAVGAPTPFVNLSSVATLAAMTWNYNGLGPQTIPTTGFTHRHIQTSGSGAKTVAAGSLTVNGNLSVGAGTTWDGGTNNPTVSLRGNLTNNGTFTAGTGTYTFNGTTAQVLSGTAAGTSFNNLVLNNATGLTVQHSVTASGVLTLTSGVLTTSGAGVEMITSASCLTSVTRTSGRVAGTLRKTIPAGSPTCAFEIGDTTSYRPITALTFTGVTAPFGVSASSSQTAGDHAAIASSFIKPALSVNRTWTLTNQGPGSPFTSYTATFNFLSTDDDAGTTPANFQVARYGGSSWTRETVSSATATTTRITGATGFGDFAIGEPALDHYELSQPSTGLACLPSTVTVTACADASSPCTNAATFVAGQTATLASSGATLGSTSLSFDASGTASTTLSYPTASDGAVATVTLSGESMPAGSPRQCCPDGVACAAADNCSTTFSTAGFVIASSAGGAATTVPTQTAGTTSAGLVLRAVKTGTSTAACEAALTSPTAVDWAYECNDPAACAGSNLLRIDSTPVQRNNDGSVSGYTAVTMNFDASGNAPFTFTFDDVGLATLWVRKTVNSAVLQGNSNAFVSKPAGFTVTGLAQTAAPNTANPGATGATGGVFVKAGEAFGATVTATTSTGAAAPSFGRESSPEGVSLTPTLVLPVGGSSGTLGNGSIAGGSFTNGVATVTNLAFSEVGIVTLTPTLADGNYLGAGNVTGTATGNVGRFVPARFALSAPTLTHRAALACAPASAYTYLDENFRLTMTLTAQNAAGATTTNYRGAFARFDATSASSWGLAGIAGSTVFSGASGRLSLGSAAGSWTDGVLAGATLNAAALRSSAPDGPFDAVFGIAPTDPDGVALASVDLDTDSPANGNDRATVATVALRFGRLRLVNAIGAADRPLALALQAESWNGSGFALNTLDSCTTVPTTAVNLGRRRGSLIATDVAASADVTLAGGAGRLQLSAPGGGRSGTLDVALSLGATATDAGCVGPWAPTPAATLGAGLTALRSNWCSSAYAHDPAARATFGRQRTSGTTVYRRENF